MAPLHTPRKARAFGLVHTGDLHRAEAVSNLWSVGVCSCWRITDLAEKRIAVLRGNGLEAVRKAVDDYPVTVL
jgi:hypothetical protein